MSLMRESIYPDCPTILRTVEVGGRTKDELFREFQTRAISMNAYGTMLFDDPGWEPSESAYDLTTVEVTVRQLGFPAGSITAEIYARAESLGLSWTSPRFVGAATRAYIARRGAATMSKRKNRKYTEEFKREVGDGSATWGLPASCVRVRVEYLDQ
ncbi:MAG TPA: hypothetical protein VMM56_01345 [Planctomycetaceae bacterium]|nr:hypothetical protein [Planctomycetaceae bacterium]